MAYWTQTEFDRWKTEANFAGGDVSSDGGVCFYARRISAFCVEWSTREKTKLPDGSNLCCPADEDSFSLVTGPSPPHTVNSKGGTFTRVCTGFAGAPLTPFFCAVLTKFSCLWIRLSTKAP